MHGFFNEALRIDLSSYVLMGMIHIFANPNSPKGGDTNERKER
jgi:hypothetical protein